jgi:hypothetical protein
MDIRFSVIFSERLALGLDLGTFNCMYVASLWD